MVGVISNSDNVIVSCEVIKRLETLSDLLEGGEWFGDIYMAPDSDDGEPTRIYDYTEEYKEHDVLKKFAKEFEDYAPGYHSGESAIKEDHFQEYAQQLAEDIGAISNDVTWPCCHIDWEAAAESLKQDYTEINFDGQAFWVR